MGGVTIDMIRTLENDLPQEDMTDMEEAMIGMAGLVTTGTVRHVIITTETHTALLKRGMLRRHVTTIGMHPLGGMTVMNGDPQGSQVHQEGTLITPLVTMRHKGGLILLSSRFHPHQTAMRPTAKPTVRLTAVIPCLV